MWWLVWWLQGNSGYWQLEPTHLSVRSDLSLEHHFSCCLWFCRDIILSLLGLVTVSFFNVASTVFLLCGSIFILHWRIWSLTFCILILWFRFRTYDLIQLVCISTQSSCRYGRWMDTSIWCYQSTCSFLYLSCCWPLVDVLSRLPPPASGMHCLTKSVSASSVILFRRRLKTLFRQSFRLLNFTTKGLTTEGSQSSRLFK